MRPGSNSEYWSYLPFLMPIVLLGQSTPVEFGQNRVQYREFRWQIYPTDNFEVYFPNGGQEIGNYVVQTVEDRFEEVVDYLDYRLPQKINLMVFPTPSDLAQTNIGIKQETTFTGESRVMDYTIFVDYNGSIDELDTDIRRGITQLLLERMLFWKRLPRVYPKCGQSRASKMVYRRANRIYCSGLVNGR